MRSVGPISVSLTDLLPVSVKLLSVGLPALARLWCKVLEEGEARQFSLQIRRSAFMGLRGIPPRGCGCSNLSWSSKKLHQGPHHQDSLLANKIRWRICSRASRNCQRRQLQARHRQNCKAGCTGMPHLSIHAGQSAPERRVRESEHASIRLVQLQYEEYRAGNRNRANNQRCNGFRWTRANRPNPMKSAGVQNISTTRSGKETDVQSCSYICIRV